jgi:regulator of protease activity HflC (stomatin/prohibitin superfamily)
MSHVTTDRVDLREHVLDLQKQPVITKDTVTLEIDALVYFRIIDPINAVYRVVNLPDAIEFLVQSSLRNILAHTTLDETFASREVINNELLAIVQRDSERWGVRIMRVEVVDIDPPADVRQAMEEQIKAERERRSLMLSADGKRESAVIRSRGTAAQILNRAEAERASTVLRAKGTAEAKRLEAQAQARSLRVIKDALTAAAAASEDAAVKATEYLTAIGYLTSLGRLARSNGDATLVLLPQGAVDVARAATAAAP